MVPRKCKIYCGTSFTKYSSQIDFVPPSQSEFANSSLFPADFQRCREDPVYQRMPISRLMMAIGNQKQLYLWQLRQNERVSDSSEWTRLQILNERRLQGLKSHRKIGKMVEIRGKIGEQKLWEIISKERDPIVQNYIKSALPMIMEIQNPSKALVEKAVRHPTLAYHGRFDAVVQYKDEWSILDWKTAPVKSSLSKLGQDSLPYASYIRQLAAYASAYNHDIRFETLPIVKSGLLVSLKEDGSPAEVFRVGQEEMEKTFGDVTQKLEEFWTKVTFAMENKRRKIVDFVYRGED